MDTSFQIVASLADFAFNASLKVSLLIVLVLLAQRLLDTHLSARGRYLLWLAVVASLLAPVGFVAEIPLPATWQVAGMGGGEAIAFPWASEEQGMGAAARAISAPGGGLRGSLSSAEDGISWREAAVTLWLGGALVFAGAVIVGQVRFARVASGAKPSSPALQALLDECRRLTGCRRPVRLLHADGIDAPLVTGWIRPSLLVPGQAGHLGHAQLRHVFIHELMHVRSHDIIANWLLAALQAMHWFNPLVWIAFGRLRLDRELARDEAALRHLPERDRRQYGLTLLQLGQQEARHARAAGAIGMVDGRAQLRRRILMIARGPQERVPALASALLVLFGVLAFSRPAFELTAPAAELTTRTPAGAPVAVNDRTVATEEAASASAIEVTVSPAPVRMVRPEGPSGRAVVPAAPAVQLVSEGEGGELPQVLAMGAVAAPEPAMMLAAVAAEPEPVLEPAATRPEIYRDWNAIQALARAAGEAEGPGVRSIAAWNEQAVACQLPKSRYYRNTTDLMNHLYRNCKELYAAVHSGEVTRFWQRCRRFIGTYNRLASDLAGAKASQLTDRDAVRGLMAESYRALSEFCNTDVYRQRYPQLIRLMQIAQFAQPGVTRVTAWDPQYVRGAVPF